MLFHYLCASNGTSTRLAFFGTSLASAYVDFEIARLHYHPAQFICNLRIIFLEQLMYSWILSVARQH